MEGCGNACLSSAEGEGGLVEEAGEREMRSGRLTEWVVCAVGWRWGRGREAEVAGGREGREGREGRGQGEGEEASWRERQFGQALFAARGAECFARVLTCPRAWSEWRSDAGFGLPQSYNKKLFSGADQRWFD
eukprot:3020517-Rhodomonas_salina.6